MLYIIYQSLPDSKPHVCNLGMVGKITYPNRIYLGKIHAEDRSIALQSAAKKWSGKLVAVEA